MNISSAPERGNESDEMKRMTALIADALDLADKLGKTTIGVLLNDALIEASGRGKSPPGRL